MTNQQDVPYSNGYYYPPAPRPQITELLKLRHAGSVLDIGAGFGNNIIPLLDYDFQVLATETNPDCVAGLQKLALDHPGKIKVVDTPLERLAMTEQFDVILCTMVLHFLEPADAQKAIDNMQQWTKPGGLNIVMSYTNNNPIDELRGHGIKFMLDPGELQRRYDGWEIVSYTEQRGMRKTASGVTFESARLIARKI